MGAYSHPEFRRGEDCNKISYPGKGNQHNPSKDSVSRGKKRPSPTLSKPRRRASTGSVPLNFEMLLDITPTPITKSSVEVNEGTILPLPVHDNNNLSDMQNWLCGANLLPKEEEPKSSTTGNTDELSDMNNWLSGTQLKKEEPIQTFTPIHSPSLMNNTEEPSVVSTTSSNIVVLPQHVVSGGRLAPQIEVFSGGGFGLSQAKTDAPGGGFGLSQQIDAYGGIVWSLI